MNKLQIQPLVAEGFVGKTEVKAFHGVYYVLFYWKESPDSYVELLTARKSMRYFKTLDTVASFLRGIGIEQFDVLL